MEAGYLILFKTSAGSISVELPVNTKAAQRVLPVRRSQLSRLVVSDDEQDPRGEDTLNRVSIIPGAFAERAIQQLSGMCRLKEPLYEPRFCTRSTRLDLCKAGG